MRISEDAESRYTLDRMHPRYYPNWRNNEDIVSWCGIFALYIYKTSGLKMSSWPLRYPGAGSGIQPTHELRPLKANESPQIGDLGILHTAENHHFIVVDVDGDQLQTVEGNSDWRFQTIVRNHRTALAVRQTPGSFLRPIWDKVIA